MKTFKHEYSEGDCISKVEYTKYDTYLATSRFNGRNFNFSLITPELAKVMIRTLDDYLKKNMIETLENYLKRVDDESTL